VPLTVPSPKRLTLRSPPSTLQNIHEPLDCSEESFGRFAHLDGLPDEGKIIFGYIYELDQAVGRVVTALSNAGLAPEDTVIVFASDNGAPPEINADGRNWPLAGECTAGMEPGATCEGHTLVLLPCWGALVCFDL
jgi:hypothetical protein